MGHAGFVEPAGHQAVLFRGRGAARPCFSGGRGAAAPRLSALADSTPPPGTPSFAARRGCGPFRASSRGTAFRGPRRGRCWPAATVAHARAPRFQMPAHALAPMIAKLRIVEGSSELCIENGREPATAEAAGRRHRRALATASASTPEAAAHRIPPRITSCSIYIYRITSRSLLGAVPNSLRPSPLARSRQLRKEEV